MISTPSRASILAATVSNALDFIPQTTTMPVLVEMRLYRRFRSRKHRLGTGSRCARLQGHSFRAEPGEARSL